MGILPGSTSLATSPRHRKFLAFKFCFKQFATICFISGNLSLARYDPRSNAPSGLVMVQLFPAYHRDTIFGDALTSVSVIGNIHARRWRWNPFDSDLELTQVAPHLWQIPLLLQSSRGGEHSGCYALRLVLNHNPRRQLKASTNGHLADQHCSWHVAEDPDGLLFNNVSFKVNLDCEVLLQFDSEQNLLTLRPVTSAAGDIQILQPHDSFHSLQLNGFVWDQLDMFEKFQPRLRGRSMVQEPDGSWSLDVPLRTDGGIDFRADGVYQFLISADFEEDFGFAAFNDGSGALVRGSGFGSSHGSSLHSGSTVRVTRNGLHRFRLVDPHTKPRIEVQGPDGASVPLLNCRDSIQLLGSVHHEQPFDPTVPGRDLVARDADPDFLSLELEVQSGHHVINFAIGSELFLDTMGFGCWLSDLASTESTSLHGIAWHGKPQEWNIYFELTHNSRLSFSYRLSTDEFAINVLQGPGRLIPQTSLHSLSLVGSFDSPLEPWNPTSPANLMHHLGGSRFERCVSLTAGISYSYKFVANQSDWQMVFADYELDGYGTNFQADHPSAADTTQHLLRRHGQLTTHGNPPPLTFTPVHTGPHRFFVDVVSGAYSVHPI